MKKIDLLPSSKENPRNSEGAMVELKDGRVLMWMRTNLGSQFYSYSEDGGERWSSPSPSSLISPLSPASIKRIPAPDDLFVVYNDHSGRFPYPEPQSRTPLVGVISKDEGKTWRNHFLIEDDPEGRFCYISILFINNKIILSYSAERGWGLMRITLFSLEGFNKWKKFIRIFTVL